MQRPEHMNCAQAVLGCALRMLGGLPAETSVVRYLHGGLGCSGLTCDALTGAALALGWRDHCAGQENTLSATTALQAVVRDFEQEFGSTACLSLVGRSISAGESSSRFLQDKAAEEHCTRRIRWVCDRLEQLLPRPDLSPVDDDPRLFWRTDDRCRSAGHAG